VYDIAQPYGPLVETDPVDGILPSDHYGVLADLRY
jgi:hypothetical protein